jgi:hypothetical protein
LYAVLLLISFGLLLTVEVIARPAIGLANNGDFPKMAGPLGLGPENGWHHQYLDFTYRYVRDRQYFYNRGFWHAEFLSSEFFSVKLASTLQKTFRSGPIFDIRWLGAVNGAFLLLGVGVWLYSLTDKWKLPIGLALGLIWTDVAYVQYLNSFYMDTAAMIFLLLCVAAALHVISDPNQRLFSGLTVAAGVLFASSKFQHSIPALVFFPLFLLFAFGTRDRFVRLIFLAGCILMSLSAWAVSSRIDEQYRTVPVFNVVFLRIAPQASDPLRTLRELRLGENELRYLNTYSYSPHSPLSPQWAHQFHLRCNYATLFQYYLRHPLLTVKFLYQGLSGPASSIQSGIANLSTEDGFKLGARATHMTNWSDVRGFLLKHAPWHILVLGLLSTGGAVWLLWSPQNRLFAALVLAIQILATLEYGIGILADAAETTRHLMMFHVATEVSILLLPLLFQRMYSWQRSRVG